MLFEFSRFKILSPFLIPILVWTSVCGVINPDPDLRTVSQWESGSKDKIECGSHFDANRDSEEDLHFLSTKLDTLATGLPTYNVQVQVKNNFFHILKDDGIYKKKFVIQGGALRIRIGLTDAKQGTTCTPYTSVADPDPGSGAYLTPGSGGSGMGEKSGSGFGMNIHPWSYFGEL